MAEKCYFAHGEGELRKSHFKKENSGYDPNFRQPQNVPQQNNSKPYSNHKTVKCIFFERGLCKNGPNCSYAHGDTELRIINKPQRNLFFKSNQEVIQDEQIVIQQLNFILNELKKLYLNKENVRAILEEAEEYISDYKVDAASNALNVFLKRVFC
jgi:hypothetical protein